jgi:hypothetical protein
MNQFSATMFLEENCSKCGKKIPDSELTPTPNYWDCHNPDCRHRNYKHVSKSWLCLGDTFREGKPSKKDIENEAIVKECVDTIGNISIIRREKEGYTHEVLDKDGSVICQKHKKQHRIYL